MNVALWVLLILLVLALGYAGLWYKNRMEIMANYAQYQEDWIDEIIAALKGEDDISVSVLLKEKEALEKGPLA